MIKNSKFLGLSLSLLAGTVSFVALSTIGNFAQATPGDALCIGKAADGTKLEVLVGYDNYEQELPSFIDVSAAGAKLISFAAGSLTAGMVVVATEPSVLQNYQITAKDGDAVLTLRYLEQDPEDAFVTVILNLDAPTVKGSSALSLKEIELSCAF